jgi:hypothetical protein
MCAYRVRRVRPASALSYRGRLKHGQFLEWIEREFAWSRQSAERFMKVYEWFKCNNLLLLEIDVSALYLIAAPCCHCRACVHQLSADPEYLACVIAGLTLVRFRN